MNSFSGLLSAVLSAVDRSRVRDSPALGLLLAVSLGVLTAAVLEAQCGVQRWNVKTGKDAQVALIDLSSPTPTTIAFVTDLTRFPAPHPWPPPNRIAPEETTFWTIDATLDMYKFENDPQSGDSDYRLQPRGRTESDADNPQHDTDHPRADNDSHTSTRTDDNAGTLGNEPDP